MSEKNPTKPESKPVPIEGVGEGRYLYCIIDKAIEVSFGGLGVGGNEVYTIPYNDISAVVHNSPAKPYESKDEKTVKEWVMAHSSIIDAAMEKFGTVLPFGFDTIFKGDNEKVKEWLAEDYAELKEKLRKFKDKAEYGIQIFWDQDIMAQTISEINEEIRKLRKDIKTRPKGMAYMLEKKVEKLLRNELIAKADMYRRDFYKQISGHAGEIKVEQTKGRKIPTKWEDKEIIISLSCLVHKDKLEGLSKTLEDIDKRKEFSVRFTGPWAPFSFAGEVGKRVG